jgi:hypothetical protein
MHNFLQLVESNENIKRRSASGDSVRAHKGAAAGVQRNVNKKGLRQANCAIKSLIDARIMEARRGSLWAGWPGKNEGKKNDCSIPNHYVAFKEHP